MGDKLKNLIVRALSGAVYVALLVGCTLYGPLTSYFFFAIIGALATLEFCNLMKRYSGADMSPLITPLASFILVSAVWLHQIGAATSTKAFGLYGLVMLYIIISELYRKANDPLRSWAFSFASQLYVALPFAMTSLLSIFVEPETGRVTYVSIYPLALFIFLWVSDSGAYLCGMSLSRFIPYKLFPRVSPNKSWVGSIGGGLLAVGSSCIIAHYFPCLNVYQWMGFALTVVVFGTWGDLVESLLKRQLCIKDSGNVMPGHGGFLDRFDSFLLACPAVVIYLSLVS